MLADFPEAAAADLTAGDAVTVLACGQGLALPGHPAITVKNCDPGRVSQGDFAQGALVQETINAFEASYRARAWVDFPLGTADSAGAA